VRIVRQLARAHITPYLWPQALLILLRDCVLSKQLEPIVRASRRVDHRRKVELSRSCFDLADLERLDTFAFGHLEADIDTRPVPDVRQVHGHLLLNGVHLLESH
jgi:hypothetical protein